MGYFGQLLDVFQVRAADVHVEEYGVAVAVLFPNQVIKVLPDRTQRLRQTGLFVHYVDRKVDRCYSCIRNPVDNLVAKQSRVGGQIDPESLLRGVVNNLVHELGAKQWLP